MRILFLAHSFNSLTQRLYVELTRLGHWVSVEFDINDAVTREAVALARPDIVVAPFLKRAIPEDIWRNHTCIVVHPGIRGDRGPSALDWAIQGGEAVWGVTALQASAEMDAGDIWASVEFPMRAASKGSLYRHEVTEAAVAALALTLERFAGGSFVPEPLDYGDPAARGRWRPAMRQADRAIDWAGDDTTTVLRKLRAADGVPGVLDELFGLPCFLFNPQPEPRLRGTPGKVIARSQGALCRATTDGAVWITHLKECREGAFKLPAERVLGERLAAVPAVEGGWDPIRYEERDGVGYLHFAFYNGAMGTAACERLRQAYREAARRPVKVIVLMGGEDFWSNGLDLNLIEAAQSPADESWRNINAMDDLVEALITNTGQLTVAALRGNAGAGGVFLALAADRVVAHRGVVLNPHYKSMGNLYGSEYWTYLLPRRVGECRAVMENRLPVGGEEALALGLIDDCLNGRGQRFDAAVEAYARALAVDPQLPQRLAAKAERLRQDGRGKPLAQYRREELERMGLNFYGFDPSYHVARYHFVHKVPLSRTPYHLAHHRTADPLRNC